MGNFDINNFLIQQATGRHIRSHDPENQAGVFCVHILGRLLFMDMCSAVYSITATQFKMVKALRGSWKQEQTHKTRRISSISGTR
jgi:hypothetical protein